MNFLSHYFHELPCDDPYFICGVILPDILSNFSKRIGHKIRVSPNKILTVDNNEIMSIGKGVQQHYFVDRFFHESDYFKINTAIIDEKIHELNFDAIERRQFAFSHVFLEMMMDRCLLIQDNSIADSMYAQLDKVNLKMLQEFLNTNSNYLEHAATINHFDQFRKLKFIYHYADIARFSGIMDSLNQSIDNPPFNFNDKEQMKILIHQMESVLLIATFPNFVKA